MKYIYVYSIYVCAYIYIYTINIYIYSICIYYATRNGWVMLKRPRWKFPTALKIWPSNNSQGWLSWRTRFDKDFPGDPAGNMVMPSSFMCGWSPFTWLYPAERKEIYAVPVPVLAAPSRSCHHVAPENRTERSSTVLNNAQVLNERQQEGSRGKSKGVDVVPFGHSIWSLPLKGDDRWIDQPVTGWDHQWKMVLSENRALRLFDAK